MSESVILLVDSLYAEAIEAAKSPDLFLIFVILTQKRGIETAPNLYFFIGPELFLICDAEISNSLMKEIHAFPA
jgi:hypothetical protein